MTRQMEQHRGHFSGWDHRSDIFGQGVGGGTAEEETESSTEAHKAVFHDQYNTSTQPSSQDKVIDVLPLNSRVRVVGNKRTSPSLVGKVGLVVKTACLGGWHKLKMETGKSVKVQRNGLDVLEWGNGERPVDVSDSDDFMEEGRRAFMGARNEGGVVGWPRNVRQRRIRKRASFEGLYSAQVRKDPEIIRTPGGVDFSRLEDSTLRRYMRVFDQDCQPNVPRGVLLWRTRDHFTMQDIDEKQVAEELWKKRVRI